MRKMVSIHIGNRRGLVHHIEMMISFTLFVFFVFFVIIFVKPQDNSFLGDSVVSGAHHNLLVQTQVDVVTFFVDVDILQSSGQECVQLDIPDELIDGIYNSSVSVGFLTDELKDTGLINNVDSATIGIRHGNVNDSYYIYLSNEFEDEDLSGCVFYDPVEFEHAFGSFRRDTMMSFTELERVADRYRNDYEGLRTDLGIPASFDYIIIAPGITLLNEIPRGSAVIAKDFIDKVIYDDGRIKHERITVKLWR